MLIEFTGPRTRRHLVEPYEWSARTGYVQDVPADLAACLLTDPRNQFTVAAQEPLLQLMDKEMAGRLALAEIGSAAELAGVRKPTALAKEVGAALKVVRAWIDKAAELPEAEVPVVPEHHG
jgi:hypothetical protein